MKKVLAAGVLVGVWIGIKLVQIWDDISMIGEDDPYE